MEFASYRPEWLDMLIEQDEKLRMDKFTADDALRLGLIMARLARDEYCQPISIRIIIGGHTAFSHLMDGTDSFNDWWMDKKLNTCRASGVSSIRTLVEIGEGKRAMEPEFENENDYALCGGCWPVRDHQGKLLGYVESSGMSHERDHQLLIDAVAELLNVEVPSIVE